jgi:hypothetical protein
MIFNFYLPDEVLRDCFGPYDATPENKEGIENMCYISFLAGLRSVYYKSEKLTEFMESEEIKDKACDAIIFTGALCTESMLNIMRGDDETT